MARTFSPVSFWLQWTFGTAVIFAIAVALFNVWGLLAVATILLGFWQGWLLRHQVAVWRWWIVTVGFGWLGLFLVILLTLFVYLPGPLFSFKNILSGAVMGASLGLGQALILRQQITHPTLWIAISALALALGAGWVIDIAVRLSFTMEVPYSRVISPLAEALLRSNAAIQQVCQFSQLPPPAVVPYPLKEQYWLYQCRGVGVAIAFLSGLIGGAIKGGGMAYLLQRQEFEGERRKERGGRS